MRERRKYVRSDGLVLVNYKIPNLHLEGKSSVFDIGGNGVRITVEEELKVDTSVEMEIYLPGSSQPIMAKGEVIWAQKCKEKLNIQQAPKKEYFYAGIKFTVIDENSKNRITNYVHHKIHQAR